MYERQEVRQRPGRIRKIKVVQCDWSQGNDEKKFFKEIGKMKQEPCDVNTLGIWVFMRATGTHWICGSPA